MSNIHEQAMHYIYQQVLDRLLEHMSQAQRACVQLLIQRLLVAAGGVEYIGDFRVLVIHGHDRCNTRLLAFLRAAQLSIALRAPDTFRLQVVVACQPAPGAAVLRGLESTFNALFLQDDPRVELLLAGGQQLQPFSRHAAAVAGTPLGREALLTFGHLAAGRPESLLGSRLYLELAETLRCVLSQGTLPSALVTAIPVRQRRRYLAWSRTLMRLTGERGSHAIHQCAAVLCETLGRLRTLAAKPREHAEARVPSCQSEATLRVIAVDDLINDSRADDTLFHMLGIELPVSGCEEPLAAFFDPMYLTHLQRLRDQWQLGKCDAVRSGEGRHLFQEAFAIDDNQLTCLLYAPFAEQGRGLPAFLQRCHPAMRVALPYLHRALQGQPCPEAVVHWLIGTSGLSLAQLRVIYSGELPQTASRLMAKLTRRDVRLRLLGRLSPRAEMAQAAS
ncbi:hypothetical protein ACCE15_13570 [Pseudomonas parafulva]|uniref:hypothetical protein n=1 Tax=Pseudomonas parafulva TaxID=157782 RepID=UPI0029F37483|nr:hypothetical protein [Pseudomonas putida]